MTESGYPRIEQTVELIRVHIRPAAATEKVVDMEIVVHVSDDDTVVALEMYPLLKRVGERGLESFNSAIQNSEISYEYTRDGDFFYMSLFSWLPSMEEDLLLKLKRKRVYSWSTSGKIALDEKGRIVRFESPLVEDK